MERHVDIAADVRLWVDDTCTPGPALLLIMGANASGVTWPQGLVDELARHHRVIRYDHRDTGRSSRVFDARPYPLRDLATDAIAVLDALGVDRAHVAGMSLGGGLAQLLCLDHPDRLLSATLLCTFALGGATVDGLMPQEPDPEVLAMWEHLAQPRDREAELDWQTAHWRLLNGNVLPFDTNEFEELTRRVFAHAGTHVASVAHALASPDGFDRGGELASVSTPTLVIAAPQDPACPVQNAHLLARLIPGATQVTIDGMGHALNSAILPQLVTAISSHTLAR